MGEAEFTLEALLVVIGIVFIVIGISSPQLPLVGYQLDLSGRLLAVLVGGLLVGGALVFDHFEGESDNEVRKAVTVRWGKSKGRR